MIEKLIEHLSELDDPRCPGKVEHRLIDILVIAICAVIACAESWEDIALYGRSKLDWLRQFLALPNGIPSHDTFRRGFMLIDPNAFEACFTAWVRGITTRGEQEVVAIDGKTVRRSFDRGREQSPLHLVSAWASEQGLVLGQRRVDDKSNEITAIPELLDVLTLEHTLVTLDAMGCQKAIAQRILERQADYLLVLKANHGNAYEAVQSHFDSHCFEHDADLRPVVDAFDDSLGRLVRRRVFSVPRPPRSRAWLTGQACAPSWRSSPSAALMAAARWRPTSATFFPAPQPRRRCWPKPFVAIGRSRTICTGCWMSSFERMTAASAIPALSATLRSCARSPLIWPAKTDPPKPACVLNARGRPGIITTCGNSSRLIGSERDSS